MSVPGYVDLHCHLRHRFRSQDILIECKHSSKRFNQEIKGFVRGVLNQGEEKGQDLARMGLHRPDVDKAAKARQGRAISLGLRVRRWSRTF